MRCLPVWALSVSSVSGNPSDSGNLSDSDSDSYSETPLDSDCGIYSDYGFGSHSASGTEATHSALGDSKIPCSPDCILLHQLSHYLTA